VVPLISLHQILEGRGVYYSKDKRLVVLAKADFLDAIFDWERGANGGVDMWRFAELVVFACESEYFCYIYMI